MSESVSHVRVLAGKRITLGVTGSIAAYKAVGLASALHQAGAIVDVALTPDAQRFIQPLSFQAITHRPVFADLWAPGMETDIAHVTLGRTSDAIVIAPATANLLAKLAHGLADDPVSVTVLAARCPVIVAPAMDAGMYTHPATGTNVATLRARGVTFIEPEAGHLASGLVGLGRLAAPERILDVVRATLGRGGDLAAKRVLVTAGGTQEAIDPVRFIGNHSSGKTGYAIAEAARDRGARVVLVTTPTRLRVPTGIDVVVVSSAHQMLGALTEHYPSLDALIMASAVADFKVEATSAHKIKRGEDAVELRLVPNPDLLAVTASMSAAARPIRVGFAAETEDLVEHATEKLARKSLDLIVANDVSADVFGAETNQVTLLWPDGRRQDLARMPKIEVAERVLDAVVALFAQ
ncbi:MAG: bifunctional phosphopantothenoylcysteine decarboxylase/phosphopantothenate--cysteine ligase CoaBC [Chloroflexi bacterium]|nr:bifunctional phosphopantothenoylcysteine decarboxylase/phosphopantothenate--cysteine ligase CoaBC [Chloroflexota bacterium]